MKCALNNTDKLIIKINEICAFNYTDKLMI